MQFDLFSLWQVHVSASPRFKKKEKKKGDKHRLTWDIPDMFVMLSLSAYLPKCVSVFGYLTGLGEA